MVSLAMQSPTWLAGSIGMRELDLFSCTDTRIGRPHGRAMPTRPPSRASKRTSQTGRRASPHPLAAHDVPT